MGPAKSLLDYRPVTNGATAAFAARYSQAEAIVELHVVFYTKQEQGLELVGWQNNPIDLRSWRSYGRETVEISLKNKSMAVRSIIIADDSQELLLWYWYDVAGFATSSPSIAKMWQAWKRPVCVTSEPQQHTCD